MCISDKTSYSRSVVLRHPVEYNVPFLSFVVVYVLSASWLRRTLINLPYVIYFRDNSLKPPILVGIDRLLSTTIRLN